MTGPFDDEFRGRVALVTAAAGRGVGEAAARRLAAGGAKVVVTDKHPRRTMDVAEAIAAEYPDTTVVGHPLDVADRAAIDAVVEQVGATLGPIQILVNNAARNVVAEIWGYDPADWDEVLAINLSGPWYLCRTIMPIMREAGGGSIVNVSSYAAEVGGQGMETPYAVTKGGLNALTRALAHEGGPYRIRVNTVTMGTIRGTRFVDQNPQVLDPSVSKSVLPEHPDVASVAEAIAYMAGERARHITGEIINVASGAYMRN